MEQKKEKENKTCAYNYTRDRTWRGVLQSDVDHVRQTPVMRIHIHELVHGRQLRRQTPPSQGADGASILRRGYVSEGPVNAEQQLK